jgi:hypothetical protein
VSLTDACFINVLLGLFVTLVQFVLFSKFVSMLFSSSELEGEKLLYSLVQFRFLYLTGLILTFLICLKNYFSYMPLLGDCTYKSQRLDMLYTLAGPV